MNSKIAKNGDIRDSVFQVCPQRGALSPLLWCPVVGSILVQLNCLGYYTVGYVDDLAISLLLGKT